MHVALFLQGLLAHTLQAACHHTTLLDYLCNSINSNTLQLGKLKKYYSYHLFETLSQKGSS